MKKARLYIEVENIGGKLVVGLPHSKYIIIEKTITVTPDFLIFLYLAELIVFASLAVWLLNVWCYLPMNM